MSKWNPVNRPFDRPILALTLVFVFWKSLLLLIALTSSGRGYDTSAELFIARENDSNINGYDEKIVTSIDSASLQTQKLSHQWFSRFLTNLFRWDAIYFVKIAERGYKFEQEWAFGWGYTRLLSWVSKYIKVFVPQISPALAVVLAGVVISHIAHYLAVISLYGLVSKIDFHSQNIEIGFVSSILHILSPAGAFLSAPYAEPVFAALTFSALNLYLPTKPTRRAPEELCLKADGKIIIAGALFGLSTTLRSNGLLSGIYFLLDIVDFFFYKSLRVFDIRCIRRMFCLGIGGFLALVGVCYPQYLAYAEYCNENSDQYGRRPWCDANVPSIYSYVQSNYWDVGFMRYWTLSNVPLFVLATPVMCLMIVSAIEPLINATNSGYRYNSFNRYQSSSTHAKRTAKKESYSTQLSFKRSIAVPQLALALATLFSFHVQVINRVSSGYPLWYIFLAEKIVQRDVIFVVSKQIDIGKAYLTWAIMYAIIQAGLFASFLPPA